MSRADASSRAGIVRADGHSIRRHQPFDRGAYAAACALNPGRDEIAIAQEMRRASRTAMPNSLIVSLADRILGRQGRMVAGIQSIGPGDLAYEADPFSLELK